MDEGWKTRLLAVIDADGRTDRAISLAAGLGPNFIGQLRGSKDTKGKRPNVENLRKLTDELGADISKILDPDTRERTLRDALLAYGVDPNEIDRAVGVIDVYVRPVEASQEQSPSRDSPPPASRRRGSKPLPLKSRQKAS